MFISFEFLIFDTTRTLKACFYAETPLFFKAQIFSLKNDL